MYGGVFATLYSFNVAIENVSNLVLMMLKNKTLSHLA